MQFKGEKKMHGNFPLHICERKDFETQVQVQCLVRNLKDRFICLHPMTVSSREL